MTTWLIVAFAGALIGGSAVYAYFDNRIGPWNHAQGREWSYRPWANPRCSICFGHNVECHFCGAGKDKEI